MRIAGGPTPSIEGYGDINAVFRSGNGLVQVLKTNVVHLPDLCHHLFSLPTLVTNGHTSEGRPTGVVIRALPWFQVVHSLSWTPAELTGDQVTFSRYISNLAEVNGGNGT